MLTGLRPLPLACRWVSLSPRDLPSADVLLSSSKDTSDIGLGSILMTSLVTF